MSRAASIIALGIAAALLGGCMRVTFQGHTITEGRPRTVPAAEAAEQSAAAQDNAERARLRVSTVAVAIAPEVAPQVIASARLDARALRVAMQDAWRERGLLDEQVASQSADVQVIQATLQRTGNPAFGQIPATGRLTAMVRIRDAGGQELRVFRVVSESALSIPAEGGSGDPLQRLYRRFAEDAAAGFTAPEAEPAR